MPEEIALEELVDAYQSGADVIAELWARLCGYYAAKARRYYLRHSSACMRRGVEVDDLVSVGFFALIHSAESYRFENDVPFIAYLHYALRTEYAALLNYKSSKPDALDSACDLDAEIAGTDGLTFADTVRDDSALDFLELDGMREDAEIVRREVGKLPNKQRTVIEQRYFQNRTLAEIGKTLDCSGEYIRQIEKNAIKSLSDNAVLFEIWRENGRHLHEQTNNRMRWKNRAF